MIRFHQRPEHAAPLAKLWTALETADVCPKPSCTRSTPDNYAWNHARQFPKAPSKANSVRFGLVVNDQRDGMVAQMKALANLGLLSTFVGMLTDSRSFVSYPRHEYFRRILCNLIGGWVEHGEYPEDYDTLGKIIKGICYNNANEYFGF